MNLGRGRNAVAMPGPRRPARLGRVRQRAALRNKLRGQHTPEAHPVIVTAPGEEGQVDYGESPMVQPPAHAEVPPHASAVFTLVIGSMLGGKAKGSVPQDLADGLLNRRRPTTGKVSARRQDSLYGVIRRVGCG
jgi:hypothetical protein